jgi:hypothetical protein
MYDLRLFLKGVRTDGFDVDRGRGSFGKSKRDLPSGDLVLPLFIRYERKVALDPKFIDKEILLEPRGAGRGGTRVRAAIVYPPS